MVQLRLQLAHDLRQEPMPAFRFVDPNFYETGSSDVFILVTDRMRHSQRIDELLVVLTKLTHHLDRGDKLVIVVFESLVSRNLTDRSNSRAANLARAFGNVVGDGEDLTGVFVEQQVVVSKVNATQVPVKVFGLYVKCKRVGKQLTQFV